MKTTQNFSRFTLLLAISLAPVPCAFAANASWVGGTSTDWNTTANWSATLTAGSQPTINTVPANICTITANPSVNPGDVFVGVAASTTGRVDHRAGTLTQNAIGSTGNWFFIGSVTGVGTYNLADTSVTGQANLTTFGLGSGSLTIGKLWVGGRDTSAGTGTFNMNSSGTIAAQSTASGNAASVIVGSFGGTGTLNLDSGTISASGNLWIGAAGSGAATTGTVNMSGGTIDMNGKNNTVNAFQVSGTVKAKGTWGSTASSATHQNNTYFASASAGVLTVTTGGATTTTLAAGGTSTYGDSVAFTATVVGSGGDGTTPSGTVTFYDNGTPIGTGSLSGSGLTATATLNYSALAAGTHNNITATYGGSDSYDVSTTASAITQVVNPLAVQLTGSRVYDGTATAAAAILSVANKVGSDTVTVASGSGTLASANGGLQTITDFSGLTLGNNSAGNYTLTSASGSVRINPAAAGSFTLTTKSNTPASFSTSKLILMANDAGVTLSVPGVSASSTQGGTVSLSGTTITYTPAITYVGSTDSFTYTLSDDVGGSTTGTVSVIVNAINASSQITDIVVTNGVSATLTASGLRNQTYQVQASDDLGNSWSTIGTATTADNGVLIYTDLDEPTHTSRYYRLAQ